MQASHAHACGYIYLRARGCWGCNTDLPGLLSSQGSSYMLSSSTAADGTCLLGKVNHVPRNKQVQGYTAKRDMVQPLQPDPMHGPAWRKLVRAMPLFSTGGWRAPKKLCVVTCIQR